MQPAKKPFTVVTATGTATAPYDAVTYSAQITALGKDSHEAKERTNLVVQRLRSAAESLSRANSLIAMVWESLKVNYAVGPNEYYDRTTGQQVVDGEKVVCDLSFRCASVVDVSAMHDALTAVPAPEGVTKKVSAPAFSCSQTIVLKEKAFADARSKAQQKFAMQCRVQGHDPSDFVLLDYMPQYEDDRRHGREVQMMSATVAMAMADVAEAPIQIEASEATVAVTVTFSLDYIGVMDLPFVESPDEKDEKTDPRQKTLDSGADVVSAILSPTPSRLRDPLI